MQYDNQNGAPQYQPQPYPAAPNLNAPMSVGEWVLTIFLTGLPFVGFILLLVWAFSDGTNINKKNYSRAVLIWMLIGIGLSIIFTIAFGALAATIASSFSNFN